MMEKRDGIPPVSEQKVSSMLTILHHLALERTGWRRYFSRWYISDEPLRHDAARLLAGLDLTAYRGWPIPKGTKRP